MILTKKSFLFLIGLLLSFSTFAGEDDFAVDIENKNLSQLVRSSSPHFWSYMKNHADELNLAGLIESTGLIAGDAHLGNFGIVPVINSRGQQELDFVNIDFDDAGIGPLVLDFIRFEITTEAIGIDIKKRDMEEAYIQGLSGKQRAPPEFIQALLGVGMTEYRRLSEKLVRKNTDGDQLAREGKLETYQGRYSRAEIEKIFPDTKILDVAVKTNERGGSSGGLRLWVLTENSKGVRQIFELKQYQESSLAKYTQQPELESWLKQVYKAFWPGLDQLSYGLVQMSDGTYFWRREKKVSLIDIPYSSPRANKHQMVLELALYDAYYLGLMHSRQSAAKAYLERITADPQDFHQRTQEVVKMYLRLARKAL